MVLILVNEPPASLLLIVKDCVRIPSISHIISSWSPPRIVYRASPCPDSPAYPLPSLDMTGIGSKKTPAWSIRASRASNTGSFPIFSTSIYTVLVVWSLWIIFLSPVTTISSPSITLCSRLTSRRVERSDFIWRSFTVLVVYPINSYLTS